MAETEEGQNAASDAEILGFVQAVEEEQAKIDVISVEERNRKSPHKDAIGEIKKEAVDRGVPRKALNAVIAKRRHQRKADTVEEKLTEDVRTDFFQIWEACEKEDEATE